MRIGIDFDNTLACYDKVFEAIAKKMFLVSVDWQGDKTQVRAELRTRQNGERDWQRLQGQVYGKYMHLANLFPEVSNFLLRLRAREYEVFIVSHKTEYGHHDSEKISLRREALSWMRMHKFFDPKGFGLHESNVFFENTRAEKVKKISDLRCDYFIDDLWEVFASSDFPIETRKILFDSSLNNGNQEMWEFRSRSWRQVADHVLGGETEAELRAQVEFVFGEGVESVTQVEGRANSKVVKVDKNKKQYAVKFYPDINYDFRKRLNTERIACEFLDSERLANTMKFVREKPDLNVGVYDWIDGSKVGEVLDNDVELALNFVERLYESRAYKKAVDLPNASECCLREVDIWAQLTKKREKLNAALAYSNELRNYLVDEYDPLVLRVRDQLANLFPDRDSSAKISRSMQTLSPSDFGFHNAIRQSDGSLVWIDLEYFGWDDPVKLIADFIWHPGFTLSEKQALRWKVRSFQIFSNDQDLESRFQQRFLLYGLRWCLIILNIFLRAENDLQFMRSQRLEKSRWYASRIKKSVRNWDI